MHGSIYRGSLERGLIANLEIYSKADTKFTIQCNCEHLSKLADKTSSEYSGRCIWNHTSMYTAEERYIWEYVE
jgi:hypothetical protein